MYQSWLGAHLAKADLHYGVRDGGYMLLYAALLGKVHPDPAVRAEFTQKALDAATLYYVRLQYPDGSWRWIDVDAQTTGYQMQPFMVGLMLDGMVATHRLTGDPRILTAITKSVENLYTDGYRGNEPVSQKPGATWRGMWYTLYGATCQAGCGRKTLDGGWDTNGIREVRELWPLFGATNQLLAGLAFMVVTFWLLRRGLPFWFASLPMIFMLIMPAWALSTDVMKWLNGGSYLLVVVGVVVLAVEVWMVIEAFLLWPKVKGVLEAPLPPLARRPAVEGLANG
jgi:hypothetical protein